MSQILEDFKQGLSDLGITKGDIVYVGSDITQLLVVLRKKEDRKSREEQNEFLHAMIDALQEQVGEEGTLLFPVYTWSFCKGKPYDVSKTLGTVGVLNNWVLKNRTDFRRTAHPLYSFMVWGKDAEMLLAMDNQEAWGKDSPFEYFKEQHAKLFLLNVTLQRAFTFMHYVEQSVEVPYRYHKYFLGNYTDAKGHTTARCYSMYVRDLDIETEEYMPDSFMEEAGLLHGVHTEDLTLKVIDMAEAYPVVAEDLLHNGGKNCYHFTNYEIDWEKGRTHEHEISDRLS